MIASLFLAAAAGMTFTADRIAVDNVTKAAVATGHVHATSGVMSLRSECLSKSADGTFLFADPTCATTCTNAVGETHWNITGELEVKDQDYVLLRNAWLRFYEIPVLWLPYFYYPLNTDCGFSWMPGYSGRWGAFLLTKYTYHLLGDPHHRDNTWWLAADTRFDLRYRQGLAVGEDLEWNLGDFGRGSFSAYYAWDMDAEDRYGNGLLAVNDQFGWGYDISKNRYHFSARHRWEATERDTVWARGLYLSDAMVRNDFMRRTLFNNKAEWIGQENSGVFWEHLEESFAAGVEVSGRLNKFYGQTGRLPEIYLDVNPQPLFGLPVNYETENRIGYLTRDPAEYNSLGTVYSVDPGPWAHYQSFRFDTYHRFTAPFRLFDDVVSVVPRIGYHGTFWDHAGRPDLLGAEDTTRIRDVLRSILEGGATVSGRGYGWVNETWRHMTEPYLDVLAQKAWHHGLDGIDRAYVFDNLDASRTWEDQFAGRSRNLPYSYYGVTPGWRNAWSVANERGTLRQVLDIDVYAAVQFNDANYVGADKAHRLAEVEDPNMGDKGAFVMPGARVLWTPAEDIRLGVRGEYDSDNDRIAYAAANFSHRLTRDFKYFVRYDLRDHRYWDFSSSPVDEYNYAKLHMITVGFEQQPFDWFAWAPSLRWDLRENELDNISVWFDYLTDCLGFRIVLEYDNEYTTFNGYERPDDFSVGFYIYLRCFGADSSGLFYD